MNQEAKILETEVKITKITDKIIRNWFSGGKPMDDEDDMKRRYRKEVITIFRKLREELSALERQAMLDHDEHMGWQSTYE